MTAQKSNKKEKSTKLGWKKVLREISNYAPNKYESKADYDKKYPLVKKSKVKPYELKQIINFLKEQGLIECDNSEANLINLTSKGVDLALKVQDQNLAFNSNFVQAIFTGILTLMSVSTLFLYLGTLEQSSFIWVVRIVIAVFFLGIFYVFISNERKS